MGRLKTLLNLLVLAIAAIIIWHEFLEPRQQTEPAAPEPLRPATPSPAAPTSTPIADRPVTGEAPSPAGAAGPSAGAAASAASDSLTEAIAAINNVAAQVAAAADDLARPEAEPAAEPKSSAGDEPVSELSAPVMPEPGPTGVDDAAPVAQSSAQVETDTQAASTAPDRTGDDAAQAEAGPGTPAEATADTSLPANAVRGDGTDACPAAYPIKGNASSMIYHQPGKASYDRTVPEFCFATVEAAEAAGFRAPRH